MRDTGKAVNENGKPEKKANFGRMCVWGQEQKAPKVFLTQTTQTGRTGQRAQELESEIFSKFHTDRAGGDGDLPFPRVGVHVLKLPVRPL